MADKDRSPDRLAALTDGVIAIAMTLLTLDIRLPMPATGLTNGQLLDALEDAPPTVIFLLSIPIAFYDADLAKYSWLLLIPAGFALRFVSPVSKREG